MPKRKYTSSFSRPKYKISKRRSYKPKMPTRYKVADMAYQALQGVNYIKGLVNSEKHMLDTTGTGVSITQAGTVTALSAIPQGDTIDSRNGNSVLAKTLFGRIELLFNTSATATFIRFVVIVDNQQVSDSPPAITDVLEAANTRAPLNKNTKGRYSVLLDKTYQLENNTKLIADKFNIPLDFHIKFNGTTGADIQKNGIYHFILSNEPTDQPLYSYYWRLSYHDN